MSCDIKSLIEEFHQDTSSIKERVHSRGMRRTSGNFVSISSSITSSAKKSRYDPYDVTNTSFDDENLAKKKSITSKKPIPGGPLKIKLIDKSSVKIKINRSDSRGSVGPIKVIP